MNYGLNEILFAFSLTLFAGLSTAIGSALAFFAKKSNYSFLSWALGFSAGVMLYLSFVEIFPKAFESLATELTEGWAYTITTLSFFGGMLVTGLIDRLIPNSLNPHEPKDYETAEDIEKVDRSNLLRMGLFTALAITLHNLPEGMATFIAALQEPLLGVSLAIAIAIHNIPEGIAVSVPIYYATGSKKKAFFYSALSGLAEPIGAIIGFFILSFFLNDLLFGIIFASVGGIMIYVALDELLPSAEKYGEHHKVIYGLVLGMMVMAASLIVFM